MRYKIVIDSCGELIERWKEDPAIERASLTLTAVSYTHLESLPEQFPVPVTGFVHGEGDGVLPVSYTHLDVYKRQM